MVQYTLIESKLRRYIFLGSKNGMYYSCNNSLKYLKPNQQSENNGIELIANIVMKKNIEEINSIIPILLKIKQENKLHDDQHMLFIFAVCAKFNLDQCKQMMTDAYAAVQLFCDDGTKFLKFVHFGIKATRILFNRGYIRSRIEFGSMFRKSLANWYLTRDAFEVTKDIVKQRSFGSANHKQIMKGIHLFSSDPCYQIFITYVFYGIKVVKAIFKPKVEENKNESELEMYKRKQLKFIYDYLVQIKKLHHMNPNELRNDVALNLRGKEFNVVPQSALTNHKILAQLISHMPLSSVLDKTFFFAKKNLFYNKSGYNDYWSYILRFRETLELQKSKIHPIQVYLEYLRQVNTGKAIEKFQETKENLFFTTEEGSCELIKKENVKQIKKRKKKRKSNHRRLAHPITGEVAKRSRRKKKNTFHIFKDFTFPDHPVKQFLSNDLIHKTIKCLKPSGHRIAIAYEAQMRLFNLNCMHMHLKFVNVVDAITLMIMSIIIPEYESYKQKPTIYALHGNGIPNEKIKISYRRPMTFKNLKSMLFESTYDIPMNKQNNYPLVSPVSTMQDAIKSDAKYDVFMFLGSSRLFLKNIQKAKQQYQQFSKKSVKIITCSLNGKHSQQSSLCREGMLHISGFDKNVGKIIYSFLHNEF